MDIQQNLYELADAVASECKAIRTLVNGNDNDLSDLTTVNKTNLVLAVNELKASVSNTTHINDNTTGAGSTWSSSKISASISQALSGVLSGAPTALDTLQEIAAALNNDANFAATMTTQLNRRVRWDISNQNLTSTEMSNARTNIDAASATNVGNTDLDFVALFNQGLL